MSEMGEDLTPKERYKIYLEEKARSEARAMLAAKKRERVAAEKKKKERTQGCLGCLGLVILIVIGAKFCPSEPDVTVTPKSGTGQQHRSEELTTPDISASSVPKVSAKSSAEGVNCDNWGQLLFFQNIDIVDVNRCLQAGADPNARGEKGSTVLARAVIEGNAETAAALLNAGADVNALSLDSTPLHHAALHEKADVLTILLEAGADPNARSDGGDTPMHRAAGSGNVEILMALLRAGAEVNVQGAYGGLTPLMYAVKEPHRAEVMRVLLNAGADPNTTDAGGMTSLHRAEYVEAVVELIRAGAFLDARDKRGFTPLHWTVFRKSSDEIAIALLMAGADPYARDNEGHLVFHPSRLSRLFKEMDEYRASRLAERIKAATTSTPGQGRGPIKTKPLLQPLLELQRAARQGSSAAADRLGQMYSTGQGVPQDFIKAYAWTKVFILCGGNSQAAAKRLDWLAERMSVDDIQKAHEMAGEIHRRIESSQSQ